MNISSTALHALSVAGKQAAQAAERVQWAAAGVADDLEPPDRVDLSTEAVKLLAARNAFQTGITLARKADEMNQNTTDLLG